MDATAKPAEEALRLHLLHRDDLGGRLPSDVPEHAGEVRELLVERGRRHDAVLPLRVVRGVEEVLDVPGRQANRLAGTFLRLRDRGSGEMRDQRGEKCDRQGSRRIHAAEDDPGTDLSPMAETTPRTDLRPLEIGDIFDEAFVLYRRNFLLLIAVVTVVRIPSALLGFAVSWNMVSLGPADSSELMGLMLLQFVYLFLEAGILGPLLYGSVTWVAARRWLGYPASLGRAYGAALRRLLSLGGATLLLGLVVGVAFTAIMFVVMMITAMVAAAAGASEVGLVLVISVVVGLSSPAIVFIGLGVARYSLYVPAIMTERRGAIDALGRSWRLTAGRTWRMFVIILVAFALKLLLVAGPAGVFGVVGEATEFIAPEVALVINTVAGLLGSILLDPVVIAALVIAFFDLRVRREAYDLELAAHARRATLAEARA
jgi:hypothetical protein